MKQKTFVPLRDQQVSNEPRPVTTDQVDAALNGSEPLDERMVKLRKLREEHVNWANRQKETDGSPLTLYIDDAIFRLLREGDLDNVSAA